MTNRENAVEEKLFHTFDLTVTLKLFGHNDEFYMNLLKNLTTCFRNICLNRTLERHMDGWLTEKHINGPVAKHVARPKWALFLFFCLFFK